MTLRVILADDEPAVRGRLQRLLAKEPDVAIVAECSDGVETLSSVSQLKPDLLFLDIEMPGLTGLEVVEKLDGIDPPLVVFVTAYQQYALKAFDVNALDYLQKPVDEDRFNLAMKRVRERLANGEKDSPSFQDLLRRLALEQERLFQIMTANKSHYLDRVMIRAKERLLFVKVEEVDLFQSTGNYVKVHTAKGTHLIRETLANLEKQLDPKSFLRIHRGTIVNIERIKEMQPYFSGDYVVVLNSGMKLKLSRSFKGALDARMGQQS